MSNPGAILIRVHVLGHGVASLLNSPATKTEVCSSWRESSGALVMMTLQTVFFLRLILAEETFLSQQLGEPNREYLRTVPRLIPRLRRNLPHTSPQPTCRKPQWLHALTTEINPLGILVALAFFSWSNNNWLMIKVVIISFGLSIVMKALASRESAK